MTRLVREPLAAPQPRISVGLMTARTVRFTLAGRYRTLQGDVLDGGDYEASIDGGRVRLAGTGSWISDSLRLEPEDFETSRVTVHGITIGIDFHWERQESQLFQGDLVVKPEADHLLVINELPLESYLVSVISSEMSASCPEELLRAHAIVARSWLHAQMARRVLPANSLIHEEQPADYDSDDVIIRWYDRESHVDFDVCADDHCQRYQGISKAFSSEALNAVTDTRGKVLTYKGEICDTRYSKCCGGMTEEFPAAWEDRDVPYLSSVYDGAEAPGGRYRLPLDDESKAKEWIESSPEAFCNTESKALLERILPGFDQETTDFFRWRVEYSQDELSALLRDRSGFDLGRIVAMEPLARGKSGRIVRLKITGERREITIGKELQIRRTLSRSHLYSSAFVVRTERSAASPHPDRFILTGAGWGHGVGLCQIGAAVMADRGYSHCEILSHYFRGATLGALY